MRDFVTHLCFAVLWSCLVLVERHDLLYSFTDIHFFAVHVSILWNSWRFQCFIYPVRAILRYWQTNKIQKHRRQF